MSINAATATLAKDFDRFCVSQPGALAQIADGNKPGSVETMCTEKALNYFSEFKNLLTNE